MPAELSVLHHHHQLRKLSRRHFLQEHLHLKLEVALIEKVPNIDLFNILTAITICLGVSSLVLDTGLG